MSRGWSRRLTRRGFVKAGAGLAAAGAGLSRLPLGAAFAHDRTGLRQPGQLPDPTRPGRSTTSLS
jgi:hypothetical protein